jgi:hypothetical protein
MPPEVPGRNQHTIGQYDFTDQVVFQHCCQDKWRLGGQPLQQLPGKRGAEMPIQAYSAGRRIARSGLRGRTSNPGWCWSAMSLAAVKVGC